MPIRLNLLAEAQAAEELRRKDPLKRAIMAAVGVVLLVLCWIGMLIWQGMQKQQELARLQQEWNSIKPVVESIRNNDKISAETQKKVEMLYQYSTNRFLWAPALSALSQVVTNPFAANVQLTRLTSEQIFIATPMQKAVTNAAGVVTPAKPAGVVERNKMLLFAKDFGRDIDENYNKLKEAIAEFPYFKANLETGGKGTRLMDVSGRITDPMNPEVSFQTFVLECLFAEKFR